MRIFRRVEIDSFESFSLDEKWNQPEFLIFFYLETLKPLRNDVRCAGPDVAARYAAAQVDAVPQRRGRPLRAARRPQQPQEPHLREQHRHALLSRSAATFLHSVQPSPTQSNPVKTYSHTRIAVVPVKVVEVLLVEVLVVVY